MKNTNRHLPGEINGIVERIVAALAPDKLILLGSYAYGNANFQAIYCPLQKK